MQGNNNFLIEKVEKFGVESKAGTILLINKGLGHHDKIIESQQGIYNEVLKDIEQQENCCFELKSGIDSVKDHIESKNNLFDFPFKAIFGIGSATFVQMFFQKLKGRVVVYLSLTFVFGTLYLMGS